MHTKLVEKPEGENLLEMLRSSASFFSVVLGVLKKSLPYISYKFIMKVAENLRKLAHDIHLLVFKKMR